MTLYVVLEGPLGKRHVESGSNLVLLPGEVPTGITQEIGAGYRDEVQEGLDALAEETGIAAGDLIKQFLTALNIKPDCTMCDFRRYVFNHRKSLGVKETVKALWKSVTGKVQSNGS